ncbi:MAG TPA: transposase [bacterium]|nr:transposase [bacterium]HPL95228.1 transposase [bacterium]
MKYLNLPIRPRLPHTEYIGQKRYFITINSFNRKNYFVDKKIISFIKPHLFESLKSYNFEVWIFLFMPDHLHLLLEAKDINCNLENFIKDFKQKSSYCFKKIFRQRLWAKSYWDHILRKDEDITGIVYYILYNPVRKGLIKDWKEYQWWGSTLFKKDEF